MFVNKSKKQKIKITKALKINNTNKTPAKKLTLKRQSKVESRLPSESESSDSEEGVDNNESNPSNSANSTEQNPDKPITDTGKFRFQLSTKSIDGRAVEGFARRMYGARLNSMFDHRSATPFDHFMLFTPTVYIEEELLQTINNKGKTLFGSTWKDVKLGEFLLFMGLLISMEVMTLTRRRKYWRTEGNGPFPALNYGKYMPRTRFENILKCMALFGVPASVESDTEHCFESVKNLINALNKTFQTALSPGSNLTLDESVIKAYHLNMPAKIKIPRKPRPVGNEIWDLCDSKTQIVVNLEMNEGKDKREEDIQAGVAKEFILEYGVTTACALRLCKPYWGTGKTIIADSWFGSIQTVEQLKRRGLYSICMVKIAHKNYPRMLLNSKQLNKGEWVAATPDCTQDLDNEQECIWVCKYMDRKPFQFAASCCTSLPESPRIDSHGREVPRPDVAAEYFRCAGAIDQHNHVRTGSMGLEDALRTQDPFVRQFSGLFGFIESNAYLSYRNFTNDRLGHDDFREKLVISLLNNPFLGDECLITRSSGSPAVSVDHSNGHVLVPYEQKRKQVRCFYCYHVKQVDRKTHYYCQLCGEKYGLCSPHNQRDCFAQHIARGMPTKTYKKRHTACNT